MAGKIKLSHEEVDVKLFLEVLGVYAILALVLIGAYYLEPAITGFVTVEKRVNYTDDVNFAADENEVFVWALGNPGQLKSVKIDGILIGNGSAKAYIEHEGIRYLVLDNSKLAEKPSGLFGITGFAVKENGKEEIKTEIEGILNDGQRGLFEMLVSDINSTRNNAEIEIETSDGPVKKVVKGITTETQDGLIDSLSISLENSTEIKIKIESEFKEEEMDEEAPINETPISNETMTNETQTNETQSENKTAVDETIEKTIGINLEYGNNEIYDANNDGVEALSGVIDFSVDASFNWNADESKLCTRYEIFSVEDEESNFACHGNSDCCALVGLESSRDLWNENLLLSYGSYGSTESNIVFAQVLYANYSLNPEEPYSDVKYSRWSNLTAEFIEGVEFEDVCIESCAFEGNETGYSLVVEVEDAELRISRIDYIIEENAPNSAPELAVEIENLTITKNNQLVLELKKHFIDADGDELIYSHSEAENIAIIFEDDAARIIPDENFTGTRLLFIAASDLYEDASSNVFKIEVVDAGIELLDVQKGDNITVSFLAYGTNNLTISAMGSYAEFFKDNDTTINDMEIIGLKCGDFEIFDKNSLIETDRLWFILENDSRLKMDELVQESALLESMFVEDYSCGDTSYLAAKVLEGGIFGQEIKFGNNSIIADAADVAVSGTFEIRNKDDNKLAVFDSFGNLDIAGNLTENATIANDGNDFMIQDPNGIVNLLITNPEGNILIRGFLNENQTSLVPGLNSFIVQNNLGNVVAYVDSNGGLFLKGVLEENAVLG